MFSSLVLIFAGGEYFISSVLTLMIFALTFRILFTDTKQFAAFLFFSFLVKSTNTRFGNREKMIGSNTDNDNDISNRIKECYLVGEKE
jgi:ABC-type transport system involved in Fe-S cluster assembly fused permease/ATPase subunit